LDAVMDALGMPSAASYLEYADAFAREHGAAASLEACVTIGCSEKSYASTAAAVDGSERVYGAYGCHPLSAGEWPNTRARVRELLTTGARVVAVGETGLDYHRIDRDVEDVEAYKKTQSAAFEEQMRLATELGLPLIVHTREAEEDTLRLMKAHLPEDARVHVHCFTSSAEMAKELLRAFPNLCLGFTGVSTFKNGQNVRDTIKEVPLERILLETDAPYMAPVPFRGQTCHPAMGERVAHAVAAQHDVAVEDVFARCRENTRRVYGI
jgi:TatD DNase family protein